MAAHDASAEALFRLLFGRTSVGYGVIAVARATKGCNGKVWERHALDVVADESGWVDAIDMLIGNGVQSEVWPFVCNAGVLSGIGTGARHPAEGSVLRSSQATVALVWTTPVADALERFIGIGGHLFARGLKRYGLLALDKARPMGELTKLTGEIGNVLGAEPLSYRKSIPLPGIGSTRFVTDIATALTQAPVSDEDIASAGLRRQSMPPFTAEVSA